MSGLTFTVRWEQEAPHGSPADATRGSLVVRLGNRVIWGSQAEAGAVGFTWTWVDFLEHQARCWQQLLLAPYPHALALANPADFPAHARGLLDAVGGPEHEALETAVWAFTEAHDLAHGVAGAELPSLWVVPDGPVCRVATSHGAALVREQEAVAPLERFCTEIAGRLAALDHPRAVAARTAWANRLEDAGADLAAVYSGWDAEDLPASLLKGGINPATPDRRLAAARTVRGLVSTADLSKILAALESPPDDEAEALTALTDLASRRELPGAPWEQGHALAQWLRGELDAGLGRVDPEALLESWGVAVRNRSLACGQLDAVAVWGDAAPVIVVNTRGPHARWPVGRRSTLAHEICHLLRDRRTGLPLAEALGGAVPVDVEARARAFAAELLLPREAAAQAWGTARIDTVVRRLKSRYGVSAEVVAWQLRNAELQFSGREQAWLRRLVSRPFEF